MLSYRDQRDLLLQLLRKTVENNQYAGEQDQWIEGGYLDVLSPKG